mmetsp:Transcript_34266/g.80066  ORF Transcript_34266/g.80066 Transcript_34266/m.80066 type:complete len:584 (+) Transcript_34266:92-1843(+)
MAVTEAPSHAGWQLSEKFWQLQRGELPEDTEDTCFQCESLRLHAQRLESTLKVTQQAFEKACTELQELARESACELAEERAATKKAEEQVSKLIQERDESVAALRRAMASASADPPTSKPPPEEPHFASAALKRALGSTETAEVPPSAAHPAPHAIGSPSPAQRQQCQGGDIGVFASALQQFDQEMNAVSHGWESKLSGLMSESAAYAGKRLVSREPTALNGSGSAFYPAVSEPDSSHTSAPRTGFPVKESPPFRLQRHQELHLTFQPRNLASTALAEPATASQVQSCISARSTHSSYPETPQARGAQRFDSGAGSLSFAGRQQSNSSSLTDVALLSARSVQDASRKGTVADSVQSPLPSTTTPRLLPWPAYSAQHSDGGHRSSGTSRSPPRQLLPEQARSPQSRAFRSRPASPFPLSSACASPETRHPERADCRVPVSSQRSSTARRGGSVGAGSPGIVRPCSTASISSYGSTIGVAESHRRSSPQSARSLFTHVAVPHLPPHAGDEVRALELDGALTSPRPVAGATERTSSIGVGRAWNANRPSPAANHTQSQKLQAVLAMPKFVYGAAEANLMNESRRCT